MRWLSAAELPRDRSRPDRRTVMGCVQGIEHLLVSEPEVPSPLASERHPQSSNAPSLELPLTLHHAYRSMSRLKSSICSAIERLGVKSTSMTSAGTVGPLHRELEDVDRVLNVLTDQQRAVVSLLP